MLQVVIHLKISTELYLKSLREFRYINFPVKRVTADVVWKEIICFQLFFCVIRATMIRKDILYMNYYITERFVAHHESFYTHKLYVSLLRTHLLFTFKTASNNEPSLKRFNFQKRTHVIKTDSRFLHVRPGNTSLITLPSR